jgi:hypothetical protein
MYDYVTIQTHKEPHWLYPDIWSIKVANIKLDYTINRTSLNKVSDMQKCVIIRNDKKIKIEK